jgi:hypothetical protein
MDHDLILSFQIKIRQHRHLCEEFNALAAQARRQIERSLETLRRSRALPGLKYADAPEPSPERRSAA